MLATRRRGLSADCGSWNTICARERRRCSAAVARLTSIGRPDRDACRSDGCSSPMISRASVLLPLPLSPTSADELVLARSRSLTSRTAANSARPNSPPRGEIAWSDRLTSRIGRVRACGRRAREAAAAAISRRARSADAGGCDAPRRPRRAAAARACSRAIDDRDSAARSGSRVMPL